MQYKHNQGALRSLGVPLVPTEEEVQSAREAASLPRASDVWAGVHRTQMEATLRGKLSTLLVQELHEEAAKLGLTTAKRKADLVESIVAAQYLPPSPPPLKKGRVKKE